eukprot:CAMPEP_0196156754 /NCGR_PEP_ID=MMETSP0910-20130528/42834_1 /TAXON_ID=49265 /ORGANISM="Thalassiosira rotula, Strain GSO102" /LENGTH=33 /DNA_ID= /DNA_START= /DNA_END= /DNA_ORIENTATION=
MKKSLQEEFDALISADKSNGHKEIEEAINKCKA